MARPTEVEFLKALACMAWADGEFSNAELNFIKHFARQFALSGDEWLELEMYVDERVHAEEARRVVRRFLSRVRRPAERRMLLAAVEQLLKSDEEIKAVEREWLEDLRDAIGQSRPPSFILDGLRSFLRIGAAPLKLGAEGREAEFHDFIHNRALFKLRRRVGTERLEREASPEKLKKLTLSATLMAQVGYVDDEFLPQEADLIKGVLGERWDISPPLVEAVTAIAVETVAKGADLYRLTEEAKAALSIAERKNLLEGLFAVAKAEKKMSVEEIEEIRKIAYGFGFTHREFINAKLKVMGKS